MAEMGAGALHLWEDEPRPEPAAPEEAGEIRLRAGTAGDGVVIAGMEGEAQTLVIPAEIDGRPVTAIGDSAFRGRAGLVRVELPEGLRRVGRSAFQGCAALREARLPATLEALGESAFQGCAMLSAIDLPAGLDVIPDRAFYGCSALEAVTVPEGTERIGERAFAQCRGLRAVSLPEGLTGIGHNAFAGCGALKSLDIPASVMELSASAVPRGILSDGQLFLRPQAVLVRAEVKRRYALPAGTRVIAGGALAGNDALLEVDFGDVLERIGPYALENCVCLKRVSLPDTVVEVGRGAFSGCERMTRARLSRGLRRVAGELFRGCRSLETVALPEGLEEVGERAFEDCRALAKLALPEGVRAVGERAFYRCAALERLELPASLRGMGKGALSGCAGLRVLVLRCAVDEEMLSVLADARRAAIVTPGQPPSAFPGHWRKRVCLGFALGRREGIAFAPDVGRACMDWMRAHGSAFLAEAQRDTALMHLLADGECLTLRDAQALLERAEGPDRDEYHVTLLDYCNRRSGEQQAGPLSLW